MFVKSFIDCILNKLTKYAAASRDKGQRPWPGLALHSCLAPLAGPRTLGLESLGLECMGLDSVSLEPGGLEFMGPGGGGWARLMGLEFMGPIIKPSSNIIKRETSGVESSGVGSSGVGRDICRPPL